MHRLTTGISGLDTILQGGLAAGGIHVVQGAGGAGKTILANQISFHQARQGGPVLYLTLLSEPHDRLLHNLEGFDFVDRSVIPERLSYISAGPGLAPSGLVQLIRQSIRREHTRLLVVDGLCVDPEAAWSPAALRACLHELQGAAALSNCTLLVLIEAGGHDIDPACMAADGRIELRCCLHGTRTERCLIAHKLRGSRVLEGPHSLTIGRDGLTVYPRLDTLIDGPPRRPVTDARLRTGIPGLDRMTGGGVPALSSTLVAGPPGSGKTTLGLSFLAQCGPDQQGLLFSCEEAQADILFKAESLGIDLRSRVAEGTVHLAWHPPYKTSLDELAAHLVEAIDRSRAVRVFVDGIGTFHRAEVQPDRFSGVFSALCLTLRERGATILFSLQGTDLFSPESLILAEISAIAENVILLRYVEREAKLVRLLSIIKLRRSGFVPAIRPFEITGRGIVLHVEEGTARSRRPSPDRDVPVSPP